MAENKTNIVEILKKCPKGMKLNCSIFDNLYFDYIDDSLNDLYPIHCYIKQSEAQSVVRFTKYGTYILHPAQKCVIFPEGRTSWEGFVPPVEFKSGDMVCTGFNGIAIIKDKLAFGYTVYCALKEGGDFYLCAEVTPMRLAAEEEKKRLLQAIKDNGYKWDEEAKIMKKLIKPKFKVGDRLRHKEIKKGSVFEISEVRDSFYTVVDSSWIIYMEFQDLYEPIPDKFDTSSLKPFDKVLVRNSNDGDWACDLFSHLRHEDSLLNKFRCIGVGYKYCIPFEGNEHLCGTSDDCAEFYKNWEE